MKDWMPETGSLITPYLTVRESEAAMRFYQEAFGFEAGDVARDKSGAASHVSMMYHGKTAVMFSPEGAFGGKTRAPRKPEDSPVMLYIYCEDVDALVARAEKHGATIIAPPEKMFWGDKMARLLDAEGYVWTFATKVGEFDAEAAERALSEWDSKRADG